MGIFSKLAFWKKKEDFGDIEKDLGLGKDMDLGKELGLGADMGMGETGGYGTPEPNIPASPGLEFGTEHIAGSSQPLQPSRYQGYQPYAQTGFQQPYQPAVSPPPPTQQEQVLAKDIEIISYKLDALKAALENVSQRLMEIERIAKGEQETAKRSRGW